MKYRYQVVSGMGVWGPLRTYNKAVEALRQLDTCKSSTPCELERVAQTQQGSRYWRWRNGEWRLFSGDAIDMDDSARLKWGTPEPVE